MNREKLTVNRVVVVEGKYDKIRLSNILNADIFVVNGFSVFKNKDIIKTLKLMAKDRGVLVITDSDTAGYKIRVFLEKVMAGIDVINVFVPQIVGKEKRKTEPSKQGFLGVEGIADDVLYEILQKYVDPVSVSCDIDVPLLYKLGFTGVTGAKALKNRLLEYIGVQSDISNKFLLRILNERYTKQEFIKLVKELKEGENNGD